jgi:hypothetical protein
VARPALTEIFRRKKGTREKRHTEIIYGPHVEHGYRMGEIAEQWEFIILESAGLSDEPKDFPAGLPCNIARPDPERTKFTGSGVFGDPVERLVIRGAACSYLNTIILGTLPPLFDGANKFGT